jgi:hypothetical protein
MTLKLTLWIQSRSPSGFRVGPFRQSGPLIKVVEERMHIGSTLDGPILYFLGATWLFGIMESYNGTPASPVFSGSR